jgi:hypothetical protein
MAAAGSPVSADLVQLMEDLHHQLRECLDC